MMLDIIIEIVVEWIVGPLLDLLSSKRTSGKWHLYYLFPIAAVIGAGMWWAGARFDIILLFVFGVLITVTCGLISVLTFIPIKVQEWQDTKSYIADKKRKAETEKDNTDKKS